MKRILLTSVDYGLAFGVDRALRGLVAEGRLSAVGCLVVSDLWSREYLPLRDCVDAAPHRTRVGVTLTLTRPHAPLSVKGRSRFGEALPGRGWWRRRDALRLVPRDVLVDEVEAQLTCFEEYYQRPPDFLHVADELLALPRIAHVVLRTASLRRHRPLIVTPRLHADGGVEARFARRFRRFAERYTLRVLPRGPAFPDVACAEAQQTHLRRGLAGVEDLAVVTCRPGTVDDRLRRLEPLARQDVREAQLAFLSGEAFPLLLVETDTFLF